MHGIIALDIDGTSAEMGKPISLAVAGYLSELSSQWQIIFITGRSFPMLRESLQRIFFPYHIAIQNGATILKMPEKTVVHRCYLSQKILPEILAISKEANIGCVIYSGVEHGDICYYSPKDFSQETLDYLLKRAETFHEVWESVPSFEKLNIEMFASVKFFGEAKSANAIAKRLERELGLHAPTIRDAYSPDRHVTQATHAEVDKGKALRTFAGLYGYHGKVIAAGDDFNDRTMLEEADIKIVMSTAPREILEMADVIAPPIEADGLIEGLKMAVARA